MFIVPVISLHQNWFETISALHILNSRMSFHVQKRLVTSNKTDKPEIVFLNSVHGRWWIPRAYSLVLSLIADRPYLTSPPIHFCFVNIEMEGFWDLMDVSQTEYLENAPLIDRSLQMEWTHTVDTPVIHLCSMVLTKFCGVTVEGWETGQLWYEVLAWAVNCHGPLRHGLAHTHSPP